MGWGGRGESFVVGWVSSCFMYHGIFSEAFGFLNWIGMRVVRLEG